MNCVVVGFAYTRRRGGRELAKGQAVAKQLIYVGDPMCSWCWGFSPTKRALEEQCRGRADLTLIVGGLRPGTTQPQDDARKDFLRQHWAEVNKRTGQPFIYDILERDDFVYDTEPACRAVVTVRELHGNQRALGYFADLQRAFYSRNEDITQADTLAALAAEAGADGASFAERFASDELRKTTLNDFRIAQSLGVTGFPTVVVCEDANYAYLTKGCQPYEMLQPMLEGWLEQGFEEQAGEKLH